MEIRSMSAENAILQTRNNSQREQHSQREPHHSLSHFIGAALLQKKRGVCYYPATPVA